MAYTSHQVGATADDNSVAGAGNRYGCAHCAWACLHLAAAMHQLTCHAHSLEKCIYVTGALPGTCTPT